MVNFKNLASDFSANDDNINRNLFVSTKKRKRRHIPHSQRSTHFVERRNRRERQRVRAVNEAFEVLRYHLPCQWDAGKLSKVDILTSASQYIQNLYEVLRETNNNATTTSQEIRTPLRVRNINDQGTLPRRMEQFHQIPSITDDRSACPLNASRIMDNSTQDNTQGTFSVVNKQSVHFVQQNSSSYSTCDQNANSILDFHDLYGQETRSTNNSSVQSSSWYHMIPDVLPWDHELEELTEHYDNK